MKTNLAIGFIGARVADLLLRNVTNAEILRAPQLPNSETLLHFEEGLTETLQWYPKHLTLFKGYGLFVR